MAFGGNNMVNLLRRVEAAVGQNRFHRPPLGPLGSLLTLNDEKWAIPVEVGPALLSSTTCPSCWSEYWFDAPIPKRSWPGCDCHFLSLRLL